MLTDVKASPGLWRQYDMYLSHSHLVCEKRSNHFLEFPNDLPKVSMSPTMSPTSEAECLNATNHGVKQYHNLSQVILGTIRKTQG